MGDIRHGGHPWQLTTPSASMPRTPWQPMGRPKKARALARLAELVPCAQIINPATRYASNVQWQADWPKLLPNLAAVIVFGDRGGAIGTG